MWRKGWMMKISEGKEREARGKGKGWTASGRIAKKPVLRGGWGVRGAGAVCGCWNGSIRSSVSLCSVLCLSAVAVLRRVHLPQQYVLAGVRNVRRKTMRQLGQVHEIS